MDQYLFSIATKERHEETWKDALAEKAYQKKQSEGHWGRIKMISYSLALTGIVGILMVRLVEAF